MKNSSVLRKSLMALCSWPSTQGVAAQALLDGLSAHDEAHHFISVGLPGDPLRDLFPPAHDDRRLRHLEHVVHLMADHHDPYAVGLQAVDRIYDLLLFATPRAAVGSSMMRNFASQ